MPRADELTQRLLGQGLTEAGRTRAGWYSTLVRKLFGEAPPSVAGMEIEDRAPWPALRGSARHHRDIEAAARKVVEGFVSLNLDKAGPYLADEIWMLWPDGSLRCHPWMKLLQGLAARKATSVWAISMDVQTYPWAELRAHLPRPAAVMLDGCLGLHGAMVCSMRLDAPRQPIGRLMIAMAPASHGWRALNLPMPSVDTAIICSKPAFAEEDWLRYSDTVLRQFMLHNGNQLRSLRNHLMDRVFIGDAAVETEQMIEQVEHKEPPADRLDLVFAGTTEAPFAELDRLAGRPLRRTVERKAKETWKRTIEDLRPKLAVTELAQLDPKTQKPEKSGSAVTMMVRCIERDQRSDELERWRVAGIWI